MVVKTSDKLVLVLPMYQIKFEIRPKIFLTKYRAYILSKDSNTNPTSHNIEFPKFGINLCGLDYFYF